MNSGIVTMENKLSLIIFDCDGTIVDSQSTIIQIVKQTFKTHNCKLPSHEKIRDGIGLELSNALEKLLPSDHNVDLNLLCKTYRELSQVNRLNNNFQDPLYPNAKKVIINLANTNFLLGIATGKSRSGLDFVLRNENIDDLFITKQTSDSAAGKPNPEMIYNSIRDTGVDVSNVFMIGDTTYDMEMAENAQVTGIGVSWGYHKKDALKNAGAKYIFNDYIELGQFFEMYSK